MVNSPVHVVKSIMASENNTVANNATTTQVYIIITVLFLRIRKYVAKATGTQSIGVRPKDVRQAIPKRVARKIKPILSF